MCASQDKKQRGINLLVTRSLLGWSRCITFYKSFGIQRNHEKNNVYAISTYRQTGAHAQILFRVLANDFPQFTIVFVVILLAFSGSFFLSIRGENDINTHEETR